MADNNNKDHTRSNINKILHNIKEESLDWWFKLRTCHEILKSTEGIRFFLFD